MRKEELKKLLLSFSEEDYSTGVDLHLHSYESDGKLDAKSILEQAQKKGLKYIAISDHNTVDAYINTNVLSDDMVIPAVEFDCFYKGVLIHILGYGINIDNKEIRELCSKTKIGCKCNLYRIFALRNPEKVIKAINNAGGIAVLAHPCCYWTFNLDEFIGLLAEKGLEGVEVYYPYKRLRSIVKFHSRSKIASIADKYGLVKTGGSDFHGRKLS